MGRYTFRLRAEAGERQYTVRIDQPEIDAYLKRLPNRSEFFRRAIVNEIAGRAAAGAAAPDSDTGERLARLERAVEALSADMKRVLEVLGEVRATATAGWREPSEAEASEQVRTDTAEDDGRPSQEELNQFLSAMLNFGQKGGDNS